ncbi:RteC domain-containing protein [Cellulophaga baltica]|uniref:RteC domain-containing protein n=1 Tax=Cellulophaga TaxID=104264 RepID=UPI001C07EC63|nr:MULTISPECIES: RteC domain-containing protein [Cellulophaga]MBU2998146.1 RteC domain-containing protein [Cellulophaga baltica]MDO6769551.1 RteC domain-containing protein [Cellulophaga sp. 1_MG-2023]
MFENEMFEFNRKLKKIQAVDKIGLENANEGIHLCNNTLYLLRNNLKEDSFNSEESEIHFFKEIKVQPLSYLIYFNEIRSCELMLPKIGLEYQLSFLKKKIRQINKFFSRNWDFVHYMEQKLTYMDRLYFVRKNSVFPTYSLPETLYLDPNFFTSHDMLWARINGMNSFINYLQSLIQQLNLQRHTAMNFGKPKKALVWSASKTALTELIYALYSCSVVNDGKEDIKSIAAAFEELFNIRLDNIYKTYSEIKTRKDSKARFLEELIFRFNQKVYDDDEFKY